MLSPDLRTELEKFGLKAIPRGKAVPLLQHIQREVKKCQEVTQNQVLDAELLQSQNKVSSSNITPVPEAEPNPSQNDEICSQEEDEEGECVYVSDQ